MNFFMYFLCQMNFVDLENGQVHRAGGSNAEFKLGTLAALLVLLRAEHVLMRDNCSEPQQPAA